MRNNCILCYLAPSDAGLKERIVGKCCPVLYQGLTLSKLQYYSTLLRRQKTFFAHISTSARSDAAACAFSLVLCFSSNCITNCEITRLTQLLASSRQRTVILELVRFFPKLLRFRIFMKILSTFSDYNRESRQNNHGNSESQISSKFSTILLKTNESL